MILKKLNTGITIRLSFIGLNMFLIIYLLQSDQLLIGPLLLLGILIAQSIDLHRFITVTNRKVSKFLESVRYADFASSFTVDNQLGQSFKEMNQSFHEVLEIFRQTRAEKEENLLFVSTILQHIQTGIITFDMQGNVGTVNSMAKKLLLTPQIRHMDDIKRRHPQLHEKLLNLEVGHNELYKLNSEIQLALKATVLKMRGNQWKVVALQNIHSELQQNELEAWQNLTKVLRHEIMNSMTPISTLVSSMSDIIREDASLKNGNYTIPEESVDDLKLGLKTIENRSKGLVNFVNAYRDYTNIPKPNLQKLEVRELIQNLLGLMGQDMQYAGVLLEVKQPNVALYIEADLEQVQQVLINLLKNAKEALQQLNEKKIRLEIKYNMEHVFVNIIDNGPGIVPEALERIFVPFYTTKKDGSGIGLALSRQIMQMHGGQLKVESVPDEATAFYLVFPKI